MRKKFLFLLAILLALIIGIIFWAAQKHPQNARLSSETTTRSNQLPSNNETKQAVQKQPTSPQKTYNSKPAVANAVMEYVKNIKADPQWDWKQPINFYGRVVDESNNAVTDASVHFTWNDLSPKRTSDADIKSDDDGFFSLAGQKGKRLYVTVSKEGYYSSGNSKASAFEYANPADGLFTPDPNNPVVFHLRKKGVGTNLITSDYGIKSYFGVSAPSDGTQIQVDLLERKTGQGQMVMSQIKPEYKSWKQATNWVFKIEIPDGGFVGENDEFPFEAPKEGYQSTIEYDFQKDNPDWATDIKTNFYIKFGNPPRYGWLTVDTSIVMEGARLTYAINPTGSRNLEPK